MNKVSIKRGQFTELAYEKIKADIIEGRLAFNSPLSEQAVAKMLDISRAPVRSAFQRLQSEGLVTITAQSGTRVWSPNYKEVQALCQFRMILETAALQTYFSFERKSQKPVTDLRKLVDKMQRAVEQNRFSEYEKCDNRFHQTIIAASENHFLMESYQSVANRIKTLRSNMKRNYNLSNQGHISILHFIESNDEKKALKELREHLDGSSVVNIKQTDLTSNSKRTYQKKNG